MLSFTEVVDLGHELFANMPTLRGSQVAFWSYDTHAKIDQISGGRYSMESRLMLLGEHHGTHLDVPYHTHPGGATVDQVPLSRLILPGHLLDLTVKGPREPIGQRDLETAIERSGQPIAPGSALLVWTGQDQRWGAEGFTTERPYLPAETAEWLAHQGIGLFGTDLIGVDDPDEWWWPTHTAFARGDVLMVQQLCNLGSLVGKRFTLVVIPLKLRGGTGSPVRPIALVE